MAIRYIGNEPILGDNYAGELYTHIDLTVPAPIRGIIRLFSIYVHADITGFKVKVFRDDGTNYLFLGETGTISLAAGLQTDLPCKLPLEKGDLIGFYCATGRIRFQSGVGRAYQLGDITTNTLKSSWASTSHQMSLRGKIFSRVGIV